MKPDKTVKVAIAIDVRGKRNQRCGDCQFLDPWGNNGSCDAFIENGMNIPLDPSSKRPDEYLRCQACLDAEVPLTAWRPVVLAALEMQRRWDEKARPARQQDAIIEVVTLCRELGKEHRP